MSFDKNTYPTPQPIFDVLDAEFNFTCDGCANEENTKVPSYFLTEKQDFLSYPLHGERVWINPPFSDPLKFVNRAIELFEKHDCLVVMLLPVDISTTWFSRISQKATEMRFIVGGRVKFKSPDTGLWTDVCRGNHIAIFNPKHRNWGQVTRYIHIDEFEGLEWRAKSSAKLKFLR
ncbi:phage N-6-adenine-methyltransferase [Pasteurella testudinis DSM 23072]|uniref:Phage N-6-adenine-methyltransferase n=1 Tax=Pasteurella testudinis DSM 23072 TaxID=1122938 RepID=A0A1W1V4T3_9PAST|nr:DNA N-6-adenine-methyltransferase [Pasteurella testudinis]SMB88051.1 phage N-6-adenine-methyltransferase [Pasteurella testudinis DSM 23072]SUB51612.1 phage N-6-adenine-methyltransferase [Pasteurella testudinis]